MIRYSNEKKNVIPESGRDVFAVIFGKNIDNQ
jgi:hypothetical protein